MIIFQNLSFYKKFQILQFYAKLEIFLISKKYCINKKIKIKKNYFNGNVYEGNFMFNQADLFELRQLLTIQLKAVNKLQT